jgi:hypothetical protein
LSGTKFLSNYARGKLSSQSDYGGAIYAGKGIGLAAKTDDVVFQGNKIKDDANAIFLGKEGGYNAAINLAASEGMTFYFYDPIKSEGMVQVQVNPEVSHKGTVLFDNYRSEVRFSAATISHGTIALHNGASFGPTSNNAGIFTLGPNATLKVAYDQSVRVYSYSNEDLLSFFNEPDPKNIVWTPVTASYDPDNPPVSEIRTSEKINLHGKLHFVLPRNVENGNIMLQTFGITDVQSANICIEMAEGSGSVAIREGESVVLIHSDQSIQGESVSFLSCTLNPSDPPAIQRKFSLKQNPSQLLAVVMNSSESETPSGPVQPEPGPESVLPPGTLPVTHGQISALCDGYRQPLFSLDRCLDLVAGGGMADATAAECGTAFGATHYGIERHENGFCANFQDRSLLAGLAVSVDSPSLHLTAGGFCAGGIASCSSRSDFADVASIVGDGKNNYCGGGLLLHSKIAIGQHSAVYVEASSQAGLCRNRWHSDDLINDSKNRAEFSATSPYFGAHVGIGYVRECGRNSLDFYGKCFRAKIGDSSSTVSTNATIEFNPVQSSRLRVGGRFSFPPLWNDRLYVYAGAMCEREFGDTATAIFHPRGKQALSIAAPKFRSDSATEELGFNYRMDGIVLLSIDVSLNTHLDSRQGIRGILRASCEF